MPPSTWLKNLEERNISCDITVYLVLQTYDSNIWNKKQYVLINGYDSNLANVKFDVPQGSVFGPILFLIYIYNLNQATKFCKAHHFVDDVILFHFSKSVNELNKSFLISKILQTS